MPIRSPRGRTSAYRAVWQWPLRSPARLGVTAAAVLAAVLAISTALTALNPPSPTADTSPRTSATTGRQSEAPRSDTTPDAAVPTALPPVAALTPSALPLSSAAPEALDVAARWSAAWVRPPAGTTAEQWLEALRPLTTQEYLGVLATVDPVAIPATRVTGAPEPVQVATDSVMAEVRTDALTLMVLVVRTADGGWRVSGYDRA